MSPRFPARKLLNYVIYADMEILPIPTSRPITSSYTQGRRVLEIFSGASKDLTNMAFSQHLNYYWFKEKHTALVLGYVTRRKQPNATDPVPPAEQQTHCATCPRVPEKDACTRAIEGLGTNASWNKETSKLVKLFFFSHITMQTSLCSSHTLEGFKNWDFTLKTHQCLPSKLLDWFLRKTVTSWTDKHLPQSKIKL